jgi:hypothetical protein
MTSRKTEIARLAVLAATTLVAAACSRNSDDGVTPPPMPANFAPTVATIPDRMSDQDTVVGPIEFSVGDRESAATALTVTAAIDGTTVVPADCVTLGGTGATRTITLAPLEAATGAVNVMLTVRDPDGAVATTAFRVTVNARPASLRDTTLTTFAKGGADEATPVNGFTFIQDADDPAVFAPLIPAGEE